MFSEDGEHILGLNMNHFSGVYKDAVDLPPHWRRLFRNIDRLGEKRLNRHKKDAQQLLRENGAIHNVFGDPRVSRSWSYDPLPLILDEEEWAPIERGLLQRAELLNLILADIYGEQKLIRQGYLPAELVFSHKKFLYPCVGIGAGRNKHLTLYSADLAKGSDGQFWVVNDFAKPPFASGYALETRIIMTHSLPQIFEDFQVHRLAMYFRALRNNLVGMARHNKHDPRIVLLTPGPEHPAYFEHAYQAAYLGYPLVQGGDLTVRDQCLWLKTVEGLRQVDVVLSRIDDELSDPLELGGDSFSGVPGLLEAVRCGNLVVSNSIGSQVIENPALMAFLPAICKDVLGEELLIPSVATWWCGHKKECQYVLEHIDKLLIRPIHPLPGFNYLVPGGLDDQQKEQLKAEIQANPHLFVGQQLVQFASYPALENDFLGARHGLVSTYMTEHEESYALMPGGMTRVRSTSADLMFPSQPGGAIKDTWVLTRELDKQVNLWRLARPDQLIRPLSSALPSRAAENLFWAGRYAERSEQTARLLRTILGKLRDVNEFRDPDDQGCLNQLLQALTQVTQTYPGFVGENAAARLADPRSELFSLIRDPQRPGSLRANLNSLGYAAYAVRDMLPEDTWRVIDQVQKHWDPKISRQQIGSGRMFEQINQLVIQLTSISGQAFENMSRETAWLMLNIGRRVERALNLIALLRETLVPGQNPTLSSQILEAVLTTCNSLLVFRRRYRSFMEVSTILELLLFDENYPRTLAFQLRQLALHIRGIPNDRSWNFPRSDEKQISLCISELNAVDHKELINEVTEEGRYALLDRTLAQQQEQLEELSNLLTELYFSPTEAPQQLGSVIEELAS